MPGASDLIQILVSFFVEAGGQGVSRGGKGIGLAALRKIGWAKGGGSKGGRMRGLSIGRRGSAPANTYATKSSKQQAKKKPEMLNRGLRGVSAYDARKQGNNVSSSGLSGRNNFPGGGGFAGQPGSRYARGGRGGNSYTPRPRSFIKFK